MITNHINSNRTIKKKYIFIVINSPDLKMIAEHIKDNLTTKQIIDKITVTNLPSLNQDKIGSDFLFNFNIILDNVIIRKNAIEQKGIVRETHIN